MKMIIILSFFFQLFAFAEEGVDLSVPTIHRTSANPFYLPITMTSDGKMGIFTMNGQSNLIFRPTLQLGISRWHIDYSRPVYSNEFNFYSVQKNLGSIEVKRRRMELGLGLTALIKGKSLIGLIPYKGSMQTVIRHKMPTENKSIPLSMPTNLSELEEWNTNDMGIFQAYGGITAFAGLNLELTEIVNLSFTLHGQFIVEMEKISKNQIKLTISEEDIKTRKLLLGPLISNVAFSKFSGKRFSVQFNLNLNNPEHHDIFRTALKGNLQIVQEKLPNKRQNLVWQGSDRYFYYGIPAIIGKIHEKGHLGLTTDGVDTELDFTVTQNQGILAPVRNHQNFVYQSKDSMIVLWTSEMAKTSKELFDDRFYSKGRIMGVKGFDRELPSDSKFGTVVSQIGFQMTKKEISAIREDKIDDIEVNLKEKCEIEKLSCDKEKNLRKIISKLKNLMKLPWEDMRGELGLLVLKEPAIVHAVVKTMKYKKEVYFKFLSEKYQSLEGSSPIEI